MSSIRWYPFSLLIFLINYATATSFRYNIPRLSPTEPKSLRVSKILSESAVSEDFETFFYNQTLDHFNYRPESYTTFQQKYLINSKYWGGPEASAPIFVYLGAEEPVSGDLVSIGFLTENAAHFRALVVFIEHRFYGESIPFGSRDEALRNASTLGYFNSAQAISDYAAIIIHVKENLEAEMSPVIVIGGSYGGMLASWFRLKYPHIALGALASSAPVLYFDDIKPQDGYYTVVSKSYRDASETCYQTIRNSWAEIDKVASQLDGLSILSKKFKTCNTLASSEELKDFLELMITAAAQYNRPPRYPVSIICSSVDGDAFGSDILSKVFAGVVAYKGNQSCYVNGATGASETSVGWRWQTCSEMVMPIGRGNNTMFPPAPFDLNGFIEDCTTSYGVPPRPHWVTTYFGGHNFKLILQRFGSNIIFSNGLKDPYGSGGVLENISDTIVAVKTVNGSHCLDIVVSRQDDPEWLVVQRKYEVQIIEDWIARYYADMSM